MARGWTPEIDERDVGGISPRMDTPATAPRKLSACLDDKWQTGAFVDDKGRLATYPPFIDDASSKRLWEVNAQLSGLR